MTLDWLFPPRCLSCRALIRRNPDFFCASCEARWPVLKPPYCSRCARPFESSEETSHLCGECLVSERSCAQVHATALYEGVLLNLIQRLKYHREERLAHFLGQRMGRDFCSRENDFDLIVPAPLYRDRLRERGYNQALLLAREVGCHLKKPVEAFVLSRARAAPPQTTLKGDERRKNLKGAFLVRCPKKVEEKRILLVDDVYTTGTTVEEASRTLLKAGAARVEALVLARAH